MNNFKNDALTVAEQNNVEGGFFFLGGLVKKIITLPFRILGFGFRGGYGYGGGYGGNYGGGYGGGCNTCGNQGGYRGW